MKLTPARRQVSADACSSSLYIIRTTHANAGAISFAPSLFLTSAGAVALRTTDSPRSSCVFDGRLYCYAVGSTASRRTGPSRLNHLLLLMIMSHHESWRGKLAICSPRHSYAGKSAQNKCRSLQTLNKISRRKRVNLYWKDCHRSWGLPTMRRRTYCAEERKGEKERILSQFSRPSVSCGSERDGDTGR